LRSTLLHVAKGEVLEMLISSAAKDGAESTAMAMETAAGPRTTGSAHAHQRGAPDGTRTEDGAQTETDAVVLFALAAARANSGGNVRDAVDQRITVRDAPNDDEHGDDRNRDGNRLRIGNRGRDAYISTYIRAAANRGRFHGLTVGGDGVSRTRKGHIIRVPELKAFLDVFAGMADANEARFSLEYFVQSQLEMNKYPTHGRSLLQLACWSSTGGTGGDCSRRANEKIDGKGYGRKQSNGLKGDTAFEKFLQREVM
ncbi:unnamed protein product, partial [marine sediment metagenome]